MQVFYCDTFDFPLPAGHRFPLAKFRLLRERIEQAAWQPALRLAIAPAVPERDLLRAHDPDYVRRLFRGQMTEAEMRRIGFPWSAALVERARRSVGATLAACRAALQDGVSASLAGGTHHAGPDWGEGYCLFNDSIVSLRTLQAEGRLGRALILDCDVHQGNGTAALAAGDPTLFTFSIHGARNFPLRKFPSDLDVELPDGADDELYLTRLQQGVTEALERAQADFALYLAGADPFVGDRLGRLAVSKAGLAARDRWVLETCRSRGLPVAITMAGGYARHLPDTVEIQFNTVRTAWELRYGLHEAGKGRR
jgi:acetoin utilization deacetylase AcuC-like enzyme